MKLGLVGLPNVGKSSIFNALTSVGADVANYAFCTIEPNLGIATVPDARLTYLNNLYHPAKLTPATIEIEDIAGLVRGASQGEGLGNKFLADIRNTDAIAHVIRCFTDPDVMHVDGEIDVKRDVATINTELIVADMEYLERQLEKLKKSAKVNRALDPAIDLLNRLYAFLEEGHPARNFDFPEDLPKDFPDLFLLTSKPVMYIANLDENDINREEENAYYKDLMAVAKEDGSPILPVCAKLEAEMQDLDEEEKAEFLADYGLTESSLVRFVQVAYDLLGLSSFLTAGEDEVRAWTIPKGCKAPKAAGKIHTDFERGFIKAEVASFDDLKRLGSMAKVKEAGLYRIEGKEYSVQDGDIILFRFNV